MKHLRFVLEVAFLAGAALWLVTGDPWQGLLMFGLVCAAGAVL